MLNKLFAPGHGGTAHVPGTDPTENIYRIREPGRPQRWTRYLEQDEQLRDTNISAQKSTNSHMLRRMQTRQNLAGCVEEHEPGRRSHVGTIVEGTRSTRVSVSRRSTRKDTRNAGGTKGRQNPE